MSRSGSFLNMRRRQRRHRCPVSEDLVARLRRFFSEQEMVELAAWVALENFRSRFNGGLGLRSEGYSDGCDIGQATTEA